MASLGTLDVHAHFYLPSTDEEARQLVDQFHARNFMVSSPSQVKWNTTDILAYNDHAGVQMQMLSYLPTPLSKLRLANDFAHSIVKQHPSRFGHLLALPTDDVGSCLAELKHAESYDSPKPDGYCTSTVYNGVPLSDPKFNAVWERLNKESAVIHIHPNAYVPGSHGRPSPLIDVAFDTCRVVVDMLYKGVFRRYPSIKWILGHCGGALPTLSGRLSLLGTEPWVPNPENLTRQEIEEQLSRLYVDTAATAKTGLAPALKMVGVEQCVYGADCGVPCSNAKTMDENLADVKNVEKELGIEVGTILGNGWKLFPEAKRRAEMEKGRINGHENGNI